MQTLYALKDQFGRISVIQGDIFCLITYPQVVKSIKVNGNEDFTLTYEDGDDETFEVIGDELDSEYRTLAPPKRPFYRHFDATHIGMNIVWHAEIFVDEPAFYISRNLLLLKIPWNSKTMRHKRFWLYMLDDGRHYMEDAKTLDLFEIEVYNVDKFSLFPCEDSVIIMPTAAKIDDTGILEISFTDKARIQVMTEMVMTVASVTINVNRHLSVTIHYLNGRVAHYRVVKNERGMYFESVYERIGITNGETLYTIYGPLRHEIKKNTILAMYDKTKDTRDIFIGRGPMGKIFYYQREDNGWINPTTESVYKKLL